MGTEIGDIDDIKGFVWVAYHLKGAIPRDQWLQMNQDERDAIKTELRNRIKKQNAQSSLGFEGIADAE